MANEISISHTLVGATDLYALIRSEATLNVWNAVAFVPWVDGDIGTYDIPLIDRSGDLYTADVPALLPDGDYKIYFYQQTGVAPAITDSLISTKLFSWLAGAVVVAGAGAIKQAPNSEVDICNLAMIQLKQTPIKSIDPPRSAAELLCSQAYHQVRRQTLRGHPWNFATKRIQLTADAGSPVFGFQVQYTFPADLLRYARTEDAQGYAITHDEYQIEGRQLLVNGAATDSLNLVYIFDNTQISQFDPLFIELFAINLAIQLAPNFQGSERRVDTLLGMRTDILRNAKAVDGQERPPKRIQKSKWVQARFGGALPAGKYIRFNG